MLTASVQRGSFDARDRLATTDRPSDPAGSAQLKTQASAHGHG